MENINLKDKTLNSVNIIHNEMKLSNIIGNHTRIFTSNTNGKLNQWTKIFTAQALKLYQGRIITMDVFFVGETVGYMKIYVFLKYDCTPQIKVLSMSPYNSNMRDFYIYYNDDKTIFELWRINPGGQYNFCIIEAVDYAEGDVWNDSNYCPLTWHNNFGFNSTPNLPNNIQMTIPKYDYSFDEQKIGTWVDGKPIYRKVIKYNPGRTIGEYHKKTIIQIPYNIPDLKLCIDVRGIDGVGGYVFPTLSSENIAETSTAIEHATGIFRVHNGNIVLYILDDQWSARDFYFILEYTKTTD